MNRGSSRRAYHAPIGDTHGLRPARAWRRRPYQSMPLRDAMPLV